MQSAFGRLVNPSRPEAVDVTASPYYDREATEAQFRDDYLDVPWMRARFRQVREKLRAMESYDGKEVSQRLRNPALLAHRPGNWRLIWRRERELERDEWS
jgi:hypothetical protein